MRSRPHHLGRRPPTDRGQTTRPVRRGRRQLPRGELRLWDNELLLGWYAASDGAVRSKGTMYFALHPHGDKATGRWVGMSYDGAIITGWAAMARDEDQPAYLIETVKQTNGTGVAP
jgi:hypothetical protein